MKWIKQKKMYMALIFALGIVMLFLGFFVYKEIDTYLVSMGTAFSLVSVLKFIQYSRIEKDAEKMKRIELANTDERTAFIAGKAMNMMFYISILLETTALVISAIMFKNSAVYALAILVCIQTGGYSLLYRFYDKKY